MSWNELYNGTQQLQRNPNTGPLIEQLKRLGFQPSVRFLGEHLDEIIKK